MTLLLLLSALLSALTGAGEGARAPHTAVSVARVVAASAEHAEQATLAPMRPAQPEARLPTAVAGLPFQLPSDAPSFGERRRE